MSAPKRTKTSRRRTAARTAMAPTRAKRPAAASPPRAERRADARLVARTMEMLLAHEKSAGASERAIGEHVLDEYFAGNAKLARTKSPTKQLSYAALAKRAEDETRWDQDDLRRATLTAIVYRSLDASVRRELTADMLYRLSTIEVVGERRKLAARLASKELVGEAARDAIAEAGSSERGGGQAKTPGPIRLGRTLERTLERAETDGWLTARSLRGLGKDARAELRQKVEALARSLRDLARRLAD